MRTVALSALLLCLSSAAFAEINSEDILGLGRSFEPKAFEYAQKAGANVHPTADNRSLMLWWQPAGFDPKKDIVLVSMHGHGGWVAKDFQVWHPRIKDRGYAFMAVQWWYGRSMESAGYAKPKDVYSWIEWELHRQGIPRSNVIFTGFSMGGANSYAVTYWDRMNDDGPYWNVTLSNAGAMEKDYPPNQLFLNAPEGAKPFQGMHWLLYCSVHDEERPTSCEMMRWTNEQLPRLGATVDMFVQNPTGGHGSFMKPENHGPALDLAERLVRNSTKETK